MIQGDSFIFLHSFSQSIPVFFFLNLKNLEKNVIVKIIDFSIFYLNGYTLFLNDNSYLFLTNKSSNKSHVFKYSTKYYT